MVNGEWRMANSEFTIHHSPFAIQHSLPPSPRFETNNSPRPTHSLPLSSSLMLIRRLLPLCLALAAVTAEAAVDPALFRDLHWRNIGPFRGGRALAVTGIPGEPEHFYFGSVNGGVWETHDAGRTWQPIFD